MGFINSKDIDIDFSSIFGDLNLVIFGLKRNAFASRNMRRFYYWKKIYKIKLLNNEVTEMKKQIDLIAHQISLLFYLEIKN